MTRAGQVFWSVLAPHLEVVRSSPHIGVLWEASHPHPIDPTLLSGDTGLSSVWSCDLGRGILTGGIRVCLSAFRGVGDMAAGRCVPVNLA